MKAILAYSVFSSLVVLFAVLGHNWRERKLDLASVGDDMLSVFRAQARKIFIAWFLLWHLAAIGCGAKQQSEDNVAAATPKRSVSFPEVDDHADFQPVSITAELAPTSDSSWQLHLYLTIAPGWHIEASQEGYTQSLEIDLRLPETFKLGGDWNMPTPQVQLSGANLHKIYTGKLQLTRRLVLNKEPVQFDERVQCVVTFQACNQMRCRDIETLAVTAKLRH